MQREWIQWGNRCWSNIVYEYKKNLFDIEYARTETGSNVLQKTIEDSATRKMIWEALFGTRQMPDQEDDAVDKYAGSLRKDYPNITDEDIEESLRDAKDKY